MGVTSQFQKGFSLFLIFTVLINIFGCTTTKKILVTELPVPDSEKYSYVVHGNNFNFLLDNSSISDGILSGRINKRTSYNGPYWSFKKEYINIYALSDALIVIQDDGTLRMPVNNIKKAELISGKIDPLKTSVLIVGIPAITIGLYFLLFLASGGFPIGH